MRGERREGRGGEGRDGQDIWRFKLGMVLAESEASRTAPLGLKPVFSSPERGAPIDKGQG
jgi:hypothetical protein